MGKYIVGSDSSDGLDRRGFLKCMAWAGTGALCIIQEGVLKSFGLDKKVAIAKINALETSPAFLA